MAMQSSATAVDLALAALAADDSTDDSEPDLLSEDLVDDLAPMLV